MGFWRCLLCEAAAEGDANDFQAHYQAFHMRKNVSEFAPMDN